MELNQIDAQKLSNLNINQIKSKLLSTMSGEMETLLPINIRAGSFNYYHAKEAMEALVRDGLVQKEAIGKRFKYRKVPQQVQGGMIGANPN